ncbi:antitoxin of toxin-antitoxin stability system [Pleurocapsa sp. PCC 7327]|uniref:type II toxin-antitoxin system Phd/YefM family antitoxin n=1 Tax=Pleurocapsa sp. PCC 7327 TaxID=118163 RepID=UPI00029FB620|nr:type II toxin-antitoxin system Phd/YefM family antitoxin [Pleurocapsa sp. PCC 7327]AFY79001.1 antitoxin of toxin-antitoxin stability system [Pleurocapsa sp. PCC 7327]
MFALQTSYTQARENLATLLDQIENENTIAVIKRRGHKDIALLAADELSSLLETVYLLRSPANARRLLDTLEESKKWDATESPLPHTIDELCSELDIERKKEKAELAI